MATPIKDCVTDVIEFLKANNKGVPEDVMRSVGRQIDELANSGLTQAEFRAKGQALLEEEHGQNLKAWAEEARFKLSRKIPAFRILRDPNNKADPGTMLRHIFDGSAVVPGRGVNISASDVKGRYQTKWLKLLKKAIGEDNFELFVDGGLDKQLFEAKDAIINKRAKPESVTKEAWEIANGIHAVQLSIFGAKRAVNPWMKAAKNYLFERTWSPDLLDKIGKEEFVADMIANYGAKTFPNATPEQQAKLFDLVYDQIVSGKYNTPKGMEWAEEFIGEVIPTESSIFRRQARSRSLTANNWESDFAMNQKYGGKTVMETMLSSIQKSAQDLSIAEWFGPTPGEFYNAVVEEAKRVGKLMGKPVTTYQEVRAKLAFDYATKYSVKEAGSLANFLNGLASWQYITKMGNAVFRDMPGIAVASGLLHDPNGAKMINNMQDLARMWVPLIKATGDEKKALSEVLFTLDVMAHSIFEDLGDLKKPGMIQQIAGLYGKVSGANWVLGANRTAISMLISKRLASVTTEGVTPYWTDVLRRYLIEEAEIEVLKNAKVNLKDMVGEKWDHEIISPETIDSMPLEAFDKYVRRNRQYSKDEAVPKSVLSKARFDLSVKVGAMIREYVNMSTGLAGEGERALMYGLGKDNPTTLAALKIAFQFKGASIASAATMRRNWHDHGGDKNALKIVAATSGTAMAIAAFSVALQDLVSGKTPESWTAIDSETGDHKTNWSYVSKVFGYGAGAGLLGDLLAEQIGRSGFFAGFGKTIVGPAAGEAYRLGKGVTQWGMGIAQDDERLATRGKFSLLDQALRNVPLADTIALRGAWNYAVGDNLREMVDEGFVYHMRQQTAKSVDWFGDPQHYYFGRIAEGQ